jgi:hypothetical protein
MYPLVQELAAEKIPVAVTCRVLGFSKQAFYKWRANPASQRDWTDAHLINAALDIQADDRAFGYRFIADGRPTRVVHSGTPNSLRDSPQPEGAPTHRQQRMWCPERMSKNDPQGSRHPQSCSPAHDPSVVGLPA